MTEEELKAMSNTELRDKLCSAAYQIGFFDAKYGEDKAVYGGEHYEKEILRRLEFYKGDGCQ